MHKAAVALVACAMATLTVASQPATDDFEAFRRSLLTGQSNFRNDLLSNYADFLDSAWEEFESFKAEPRNSTPKPAVPPVAKPAATPPKSNVPAPGPIPATEVDLPPVTAAPLQLPARLTSGDEFAAQWRRYLDSPAASALVRTLGDEAESLGLNDYLTFDHVRRSVDRMYPASHSTVRASLTHFIMAGLGFDVRIALNGGNGVLLVPTAQTVYGKPYMMLDGRKYYIFSDDVNASGSIYTCRLPADAQTGRAIDMHISRPLNLPFEPYDFKLEAEGITLSGRMNKNIFALLYRYPQTDMEVYATSVIDPTLRADLVGQLKRQLAPMNQLDAVNALLHFTQSAIDYATDDSYHGFEKPYFLEEWLYYPKNDCEDRAVFYTYMLNNVLGVECQLLTFPGHESVGLSLDSAIPGDSYSSEGKTFYISDPTYIGADTGMCMPDFRSVEPEIEHHFKPKGRL